MNQISYFLAFLLLFSLLPINVYCDALIENCRIQNGSECTNCSDGYYLYLNECHKCDPSCDGCFNEGNNNCINCKEGFFKHNGNCISCDSSCRTCEIESTHCTDCKDGYYLSESSCKACSIPHCNKCTSLWCEKCEDGYYANSNSGCSKCSDECITCDGDPEQCTKCKPGYYEYHVSSQEIFYCRKCNPECLSCTDADVCQLCAAGYYLSGTSCVSCPSNCLFCDTQGKCQECKEGFYASNGVCNSCPNHCKNCTNSECSECYDGYFVSGTVCSKCGLNCKHCTDKDTCLECFNKFYVGDDKSCTPCADPNCDGCNSTACYDCIPEYFVQDGTCAKCSTVCYECKGPTENDCLDCDPGYYFSHSSRRCFKCNKACTVCDGPNDYNCTECAQGYFMVEDKEILPEVKGKRCTKCEFGCLECDSLTNCITCKDGYTKSGKDDCVQCPHGCKDCLIKSDDCISCLPGFYSVKKDNGYISCTKCPGNCEECTSSDSSIVCNSCIDGYYKDISGRCVQCTPPCTKCSSDILCSACAEGYLLKDNACNTQCTGNCLTCVDTPDTCLSCYEGNSLKGKTCQYCGSGCKTCEFQHDYAVCTSCLEGYYLEEGQCMQCSYECGTCFKYGSAFCFDCRKGYFKLSEFSFPAPYRGQCMECNNPQKGLVHCSECTSFCSDDALGYGGECKFTCTNCDDGFYLSEDSKSCNDCDPSCKTCYGAGPNKCRTCHEGEFNQDDHCEKCLPNCKVCTNSSICVECIEGYRVNDEGKTCEKIPCSANCEICDTRNCIKCEDGYALEWDNSAGGYRCQRCSVFQSNCKLCAKDENDRVQCTKCESGFYINAVGACGPCPSNCEVCESGEDCQVCHAGYYVSGGKECKKCTDNCATCSGSSSHCTSCPDGFRLVDNKCESCPSNCKECNENECVKCNDHYYETNEKTCEECGLHCIHCTDKSICNDCELHYYADNEGSCQACGPNCDVCESETKCTDCYPEYYVSDDGSCQKCAEVCHECNGPTENNCTDCDPGYYFSRPNRKCFKCHEGCKNCTGPNDYECSVCSIGYFMSKDEIEVAPNVYSKKCVRCEKGCAECEDAKQCTVCKDGYYLFNNIKDMDCEPCEPGCNKCDGGSTKCTECSDGYYIKETYEENGQTLVRCSQCPTNCKTCKDESGSLTCSSCFEGFYENPDTHNCDACNYPCATCSSSTSCLTCADGHLQVGDSCDSLCKQPCMTCKDTADNCVTCYEKFVPSGTTCVECPEGCKTCEKSDESFICTSCLDGYFKDGEECKKCNSPCATCFSENMYRCYSCEKGYYMDTIYTFPVPYGGQCAKCATRVEHCSECESECIDDDLDSHKSCKTFKCTKCEEGHFLTEENGQQLCLPCLSNCLRCSEMETCIECYEGYLLKDEGKTCEKIPCSANCEICDTRNCIKCEDGYALEWDNSAGGYRCQRCSVFQSNCKLCAKDENDRVQCTKCESGFYINAVGACGPCPSNCEVCESGEDCQVCHAGYYVSGGKECKKCTDNCATCSGSSSHCTSCPDGFRLVDNKCESCPSNCKECNENECVKCNDHYYETNEKTCEECGLHCIHCTDKSICNDCELHYYADNEGSCQACGPNCDVCESETKCTDCYPEYYVSDDGSCQKCAEVCHECNGPTENNCTDCDPGYYFSRPNRKCFKCHEGCKNCTGPNDYECSVCSIGYFMSKDEIEVAPNVYSKKCVRCEKGCAECEDAKQCTVCKDGYYLFNNIKDMDCEPCEPGCNKCDGGSTKCTECSDGYYIKETYEENGQTLVRCSQCPTNCKTCKDESGSLTCSSCFEGFYENPDTHNCDACNYPCATCSSSTSCLTCADGHLQVGDSCDSLCKQPCMTCKDTADNCVTCYEKFVPSGTTCVECPEGCKTCEKSDESFICTSCLDGYFKDGEECKKCNSPCATCFSENMYRCYSCEKGYYMDTIYTFPVPYGGQCAKCATRVEHCSECESECIDDDLDSHKSCKTFKCTKCEEGHFLTEENGQQRCSSCPSNCLKCTDSITCTMCNPGFNLNGTVCESSSSICTSDRCELDNTDGTYYQNITLDSTTTPAFSGSYNTESGGAVRLVNAGLTCIGVTFTNCKSQKAGGGIYIYNNIKTEDEKITYSINLNGLEFKGCEASYGAAVFIYSPLETSPIRITSCIFDSNLLSSSSTSGKFYGGSALYIVSKNAEIIASKFINNKGRGGTVKISDDLDTLPELRMLQRVSNSTKRSILISGCSFEIDENSDSSLFYENGMRSTKIEIKDCSFKGKLTEGAHHIDGDSINDKKSSFIIKSCKFATDQDGALSRKFINADLYRNQILLNNKFVKAKLPASLMMIVSSLAAILITIITFFIKKQNNNALENENQESIEA